MNEQEQLLFSETAPAETAPGSKPFRRELDLGDGSGVEVFEADSLEELVDKIADAKLHASAKIRQQEATIRQQEEELRTRNADKPTPKELSPDDEYVIAVELQKTPSKAFRKMFREMTGCETEDFATVKEAVGAYRAAQAQSEAINKFVSAHPDYEDHPVHGKDNGALMTNKLRELRLPITAENLHKAYQLLKDSGELTLKGESANSNAREPERIASSAESSRATRKVTSSIGTQNRITATPVSTEFSEEDAYNLPLEEVRRRANRQLSGRG